MRYNDFHETMVVNLQFLVEDQETLERYRNEYGERNDVLVCAVDGLGRPVEPEVLEGMKRRRRERREGAERGGV